MRNDGNHPVVRRSLVCLAWRILGVAVLPVEPVPSFGCFLIEVLEMGSRFNVCGAFVRETFTDRMCAVGFGKWKI